MGMYKEFQKNFIFKDDNMLTKKYVENYLEKYKNEEEKPYLLDKIKIFDDKFIIEDEEIDEKIIFYYNNFNKSILDKIIDSHDFNSIDNTRFNNIYLEEFQSENFFTKSEMDYMKYLLRVIVNSEFFRELFETYSDEKLMPKNLFENKNIQDYIIDNIIFLPYEEKLFDSQSITFHHNAQILISGYPIVLPRKYPNLKVYHILEMSRKIVQLMHEYIHAIKRYLGICTNGLILSDTYDDEGNKEEAGFLFEYYLFGWEHNNYKSETKIFNKKGNRDLKKSKIDVETALNILNPDLYSYDIKSIRNILYKNPEDPINSEFKTKEMNKQLAKFLNDMGFDSEIKISKLKKDKSTIYASRDTFSFNTISCREDY